MRRFLMFGNKQENDGPVELAVEYESNIHFNWARKSKADDTRTNGVRT